MAELCDGIPVLEHRRRTLGGVVDLWDEDIIIPSTIDAKLKFLRRVPSAAIEPSSLSNDDARVFGRIASCPTTPALSCLICFRTLLFVVRLYTPRIFVFAISVVMYWANSPFFPYAAAIFFILAAAGEVSGGTEQLYHVASDRVMSLCRAMGNGGLVAR